MQARAGRPSRRGRPPMEAKTPRGKLLRRARTALGLTQRRMARAMSVEPATISAWETGSAKMPEHRLDTLLLLLFDAAATMEEGNKVIPALIHAVREERGR